MFFFNINEINDKNVNETLIIDLIMLLAIPRVNIKRKSSERKESECILFLSHRVFLEISFISTIYISLFDNENENFLF